MIEHRTKFAARARFVLLEKQGQHLADVEQKKFVIVRDKRDIYKLARLEDLSYQDKMEIVKRIRPKPLKETEANDDSKVVAGAEGSAPLVVDSTPGAPDDRDART